MQFSFDTLSEHICSKDAFFCNIIGIIFAIYSIKLNTKKFLKNFEIGVYILSDEYINEVNLPEGINYKLLNDAKNDKEYSFGTLEGLTQIAEGTLKNIFNGKVKKTSAQNLNKICKTLGVPLEKVLGIEEVKKQIENKGIKEDDVSVLALKEIYERQQILFKETNEAHINNIRSHYEQHHEDLKENYERRLADKRELIETKDAHIKSLERECLHAKVFSWVCAAVLVSLLIAEVMNPNLGWIKF